MFDVVLLLLLLLLAGLAVVGEVVDGVGRGRTAGGGQGGDGRREKIFLSPGNIFNSSDWKVWKVF